MPPKENSPHPAMVLVAVNTKEINPSLNFLIYVLVFLV